MRRVCGYTAQNNGSVYTCCIVSIDGGGFLLRHKLDTAQVILRR